jgi:hypothetical protein
VASLAVQLTVPVIRVRRELSPPSECALPGAHKKASKVLAGVLVSLFVTVERRNHFPAANMEELDLRVFENYFLE